MKQADLAMYEAKVRGRNCYCFFGELKEKKDGSAVLNGA